ncbi:hypothetical protein [Flavobacterium sp. 5]|uniref:HYC_CC_PP family protein n=1 Tax=Flavobacterium sp. 5 TaxID=2035199 RepID=UPI000C2B5C6F|nr:hypothetical protein [Flavobacterium sp. 5]PKB16008.1 hypothetical protein CLU82_1121 [Flavobacterium sp. 5]
MKIKKQISILLAFLILGSNVGFAFNVHYCGNKIASISLTSTKPSVEQKEEGCCQKKALKKDSCCKDKKIVLKEKADDRIIKSFSFQFDYTFLVPEYQSTFFNAVPSFKNNVSLSYYCDANAPPLYKLYSQYLLYDRL